MAALDGDGTARLHATAVDELVRAVGAVEDLTGLRIGVLAGAYRMRLAAAASGTTPPELEPMVDVWLALDSVVAAVDQRRARDGEPADSSTTAAMCSSSTGVERP